MVNLISIFTILIFALFNIKCNFRSNSLTKILEYISKFKITFIYYISIVDWYKILTSFIINQ